MTRPTSRLRLAFILPLVLPTYPGGQAVADDPEARKPDATWPGMTREGSVLLPNGWSLKPAGRQSRVGDFPVVAAVHPSEPIIAILHAGYGEHEVMTVSAQDGKV